jgi:hypothetical protein
MTLSGRCWFAWFRSRKAFAAARWRNPVTVRAADVAMLTAIASLVVGDHERGRRVTGSMAVPRTQPMPIPAHTAPVSARGWVRWDDRGGRHRPGGSDTGSPAGKQPGGDRQRDADATGLARKVLADRHGAAQDGGAGEC